MTRSTSVQVIGPHVLYPAVTDLSTVENIAKLRGNIGHEFVLFVQSMIAAGLTGVLPSLKHPTSIPHSLRVWQPRWASKSRSWRVVRGGSAIFLVLLNR